MFHVHFALDSSTCLSSWYGSVVASQAVIWSDMKVNIDLRSGRSADLSSSLLTKSSRSNTHTHTHIYIYRERERIYIYIHMVHAYLHHFISVCLFIYRFIFTVMYIKYLNIWPYDHVVFPPSWKEEFVPLFVNCLDKWRMMRLMMDTDMFYPIFWAELHKNTIGWIIY